MSKDIQRLLQECLEGFDAGLSPEECLSAYPHARAELEPLFRQAISLRIAFAAAPRPEFRLRARERLLFAAGQDVSKALSAEPDAQFVENTRRRLLNTAGAAAQEALRDVPPPRLPFWVNARRHLLETASVGPPRPAHAAGVGIRSAVSAAVVVLAVAVAGLGFLLQNSPANEPPRSAISAELDYISDQVRTIERARANGEAVSTSLLDDLAERTSQLANQYAAANPDTELIEKLPDLIERQRELMEAAPQDESVAAAQERLAEADEKVTSAVSAPEPEITTSSTSSTPATPEPSPEPTREPSPTPSPSLPAVTLVEPEDLAVNQIAVQYDTSESALGLRWLRVTMSTLTFVMPDSWSLINVETDQNGLAVLPSDYLFIQTDTEGLWLVVQTKNGEVNSVEPQHTLREEGVNGSLIDPARLAEVMSSDENLPALYNMLDSIEVIEPEPSSTQTPEPTQTPAATQAPRATATPEPNETP